MNKAEIERDISYIVGKIDIPLIAAHTKPLSYMWVEYYPCTGKRALFFNDALEYHRSTLYHELGHIFNNDLTYTNMLDVFPIESIRVNTEYMAHKWAISKAYAMNDIPSLKRLLSILFYTYDYPAYEIAFKRLRKEKWVRQLTNKFKLNNVRNLQ